MERKLPSGAFVGFHIHHIGTVLVGLCSPLPVIANAHLSQCDNCVAEFHLGLNTFSLLGGRDTGISHVFWGACILCIRTILVVLHSSQPALQSELAPNKACK